MSTENTIPGQINDYNWDEAFKLSTPPTASQGYTGSLDGFTREDVAEVIAIADGYNDGDSWVGVFRLKDGRFISVSAWCDYTGWGCQDGGGSYAAATREDIIRYGLDHGERQRLGLLLPGEENTTGGES